MWIDLLKQPGTLADGGAFFEVSKQGDEFIAEVIMSPFVRRREASGQVSDEQYARCQRILVHKIGEERFFRIRSRIIEQKKEAARKKFDLRTASDACASNVLGCTDRRACAGVPSRQGRALQRWRF